MGLVLQLNLLFILRSSRGEAVNLQSRAELASTLSDRRIELTNSLQV